MSTFVKVMQKKLWPLFFRTRCTKGLMTQCMVLLRAQVDITRCKSVKEEVKYHMDKIDVEMNKVKRQRNEFKLTATRTQQEIKTVFEASVS